MARVCDVHEAGHVVGRVLYAESLGFSADQIVIGLIWGTFLVGTIVLAAIYHPDLNVEWRSRDFGGHSIGGDRLGLFPGGSVDLVQHQDRLSDVFGLSVQPIPIGSLYHQISV